MGKKLFVGVLCLVFWVFWELVGSGRDIWGIKERKEERVRRESMEFCEVVC